MSDFRMWWRYRLLAIPVIGFGWFLWMGWRAKTQKRTPYIYRWALIDSVESLDGEQKVGFEVLFGTALYRAITDKARRRRMGLYSVKSLTPDLRSEGEGEKETQG